jgi:hypothetical protein
MSTSRCSVASVATAILDLDQLARSRIDEHFPVTSGIGRIRHNLPDKVDLPGLSASQRLGALDGGLSGTRLNFRHRRCRAAIDVQRGLTSLHLAEYLRQLLLGQFPSAIGLKVHRIPRQIIRGKLVVHFVDRGRDATGGLLDADDDLGPVDRNAVMLLPIGDRRRRRAPALADGSERHTIEFEGVLVVVEKRLGSVPGTACPARDIGRWRRLDQIDAKEAADRPVRRVVGHPAVIGRPEFLHVTTPFLSAARSTDRFNVASAITL